jgi:hypothetical protein
LAPSPPLGLASSSLLASPLVLTRSIIRIGVAQARRKAGLLHCGAAQWQPFFRAKSFSAEIFSAESFRTMS